MISLEEMGNMVFAKILFLDLTLNIPYVVKKYNGAKRPIDASVVVLYNGKNEPVRLKLRDHVNDPLKK